MTPKEIAEMAAKDHSSRDIRTLARAYLGQAEELERRVAFINDLAMRINRVAILEERRTTYRPKQTCECGNKRPHVAHREGRSQGMGCSKDKCPEGEHWHVSCGKCGWWSEAPE